jgi:hypothetical protein
MRVFALMVVVIHLVLTAAVIHWRVFALMVVVILLVLMVVVIHLVLMVVVILLALMAVVVHCRRAAQSRPPRTRRGRRWSRPPWRCRPARTCRS